MIITKKSFDNINSQNFTHALSVMDNAYTASPNSDYIFNFSCCFLLSWGKLSVPEDSLFTVLPTLHKYLMS